MTSRPSSMTESDRAITIRFHGPKAQPPIPKTPAAPISGDLAEDGEADATPPSVLPIPKTPAAPTPGNLAEDGEADATPLSVADELDLSTLPACSVYVEDGVSYKRYGPDTETPCQGCATIQSWPGHCERSRIFVYDDVLRIFRPCDMDDLHVLSLAHSTFCLEIDVSHGLDSASLTDEDNADEVTEALKRENRRLDYFMAAFVSFVPGKDKIIRVSIINPFIQAQSERYQAQVSIFKKIRCPELSIVDVPDHSRNSTQLVQREVRDRSRMEGELYALSHRQDLNILPGPGSSLARMKQASQGNDIEKFLAARVDLNQAIDLQYRETKRVLALVEEEAGDPEKGRKRQRVE